ncbi:MAG: glycosyl transferase family 2 [Pirellulaceae bacterium]|nr:MAG: glycosyl transferase family 2 [Pirellulaceae bacterium]
MGSGAARVSVIIPAINESDFVAGAVGSARKAGADEVWVVDGGSQDATVARATEAGAQVMGSLPGRAVQMNRGAEAAGGDILLFLHADCRLDSEAISQIRSAAPHDWIFGAFRQRIEADRWLYRIWERGNAWRVRWCGVVYGDQAMFVRRSDFWAAGGFEEEPLLEDLLLSLKLRRQRWPILLDGPVWVSARRWRRYGLVRQTLRNWAIVAAWYLGASPQRLARYYRRHDVHSHT